MSLVKFKTNKEQTNTVKSFTVFNSDQVDTKSNPCSLGILVSKDMIVISILYLTN